jgi:hypothetical protein
METEKRSCPVWRAVVRALVLVASTRLGGSFLLLPTTLDAQGITGGLAGRVDDVAGRPVPGARILVPALGVATTSDAQGAYLLSSLPVGRLAVRVDYPTGPVLDVTDVPVHPDLVGRLNFRLETGAGGAGLRVVAVPASGELLDPTSRVTLSGDVLRNLPVDDIRQALRTEAGVVETDAGAGPLVRGGQAGEAVVFLDDVPLRIAQGRAFAFGPGTNALEEVTLFDGALAVPFGNAQSGVINLVTRTGGARLRAGLNGATDGMFGSGTSIGFNRFQGFVSGSPFGKVSLFAAATLQGENAVPRGAGTEDVQAFVPGGVDTTVADVTYEGTRDVTIPQFIQYSGQCDPEDNFGVACQGRRFPDDWSTALTMSGRAAWQYGAGSEVALSVLHDWSQGQTWPATYTFDQAAYTGTRRAGTALVLNWQHRLRGSVTLHAAVSRQWDRVTSGALNVGWSGTHESPAGGIVLDPMQFVVDFDRFSIDTGPGAVTRLESDADWDQLVYNVRTNTGTRLPYWHRTDLSASQAYRMNPWAVATGIPTAGLDDPATILANRRYWIARAYAAWQPSVHHRLRGGAELETSRLNSFNGTLINQTYMSLYAEAPREAALFGDYRLTYGLVVLDAGLRWDRFDPNTSFPVVPGRIFTSPGFDPADPAGSFDSVFARAPAHGVVSPRLRVAYGGIPGTGVRLGISRQAQPPAASVLYHGINSDLNFTFTDDGFGRSVEVPRSLVMELGVRRTLGPHLLFDVAGYLKTRDNELTYRFQRYLDPYSGTDINLLVLANFDTASVKGIDASLTATAGSWLDARIDYSYQGTDLALVEGRRHTVAGRVGLRAPTDVRGGRWLGGLVSGAEMWAQFRVASGYPFTKLRNLGAGTIAPSLAGQMEEPLGSSTTPAIKELDLRVSKQVRIAGLSWSLFADVRNLLGFTNTVRVFAETGTTTNDLHRVLFSSPERAILISEAGPYVTTVTRDGQSVMAVDLRADCATWPGGVVNCELLRRAEARWGNGDGVYDEIEEQTALDALYNLLFGPWYFHGAPRTIRLGMALRF